MMVMTVGVSVRLSLVRSVGVDDLGALLIWNVHAFFEPVDDIKQSDDVAQIGKDEWTLPTHTARIALHHFKRRSDERREVYLVDD